MFVNTVDKCSAPSCYYCRCDTPLEQEGVKS